MKPSFSFFRSLSVSAWSSAARLHPFLGIPLLLSLSAARLSAEPPVLSLARDLTPGAKGTYKLSAISESGEVYFLQYSANLVSWSFLDTSKLGNGGPLEYWFTPVSGQKGFFRLMFTTSPPVNPDDADSDGITNNLEISMGINPLKADTDEDGLDDGAETAANLDPKVPQDTRPAVFALKWQRSDAAFLQPQGWQSGAPSNGGSSPLPKPNYYRSLSVSASETGSGTVTGSESSVWKTMSIQRTIQPTPMSYEPTGSGTEKRPVYRESATWSSATGRAFTSIAVDSNPSAWPAAGSGAGAIASRITWQGAAPEHKTYHDCKWFYAAPRSATTVTGPFQSLALPIEITGSRTTWTDPALPAANGGNKLATISFPMLLPNRNHPPDGRVMSGGQWTGATFCFVTETSAGNENCRSSWTLGDRLTFASLRDELKTIRSGIRDISERQGSAVTTPGNAFYLQDKENGALEHTTYEFKFSRRDFSPDPTPVGPVTLTWTETYHPGDNPETPANEASAPSQIRIRSLTLPANMVESPVLKLDHTVSPFTRLPGDPVNPAGAVSYGETTVGNLLRLDLGLYSGQNAPRAVPEDKEETVGAFTVANLNDTDGDGLVDSAPADTNVTPDPANAAGRGKELDLMRLEISGPSEGRVKITASGGGSVSFWEKSTKETAIPVTAGAFYLDGADLPKTVWVQAAAASAAVRDIGIRLGYEDPSGHFTDSLDLVKATAVWVDNTAVVNTPVPLTNAGTPQGWDLDYQPMIEHFKDFYNSKFGVFDARPAKPWFSCAIGFEFLVKPPGIGNEPGIVFDITRRKEAKLWGQDNTGWELDLDWSVFPDGPDVPNDDIGIKDEDNVPQNNHIYSIDNPSNSIVAPPLMRVVKRGNFSEFVRVKLNGKIFANVKEQVEGSRCSNFRNWQMRSDISSNAGAWSLTSGVVTEVKGVTSFTPLGNHP